jgi:hypothetical protein
MNKTLANQGNNKFHHQAKLFGLPRPIAGALIGILLFILIFLVSSGIGDMVFARTLLGPGDWTYTKLESVMVRLPISASAYGFLAYAIIYVASSIPFAVLGSLILSKKKTTRTIGFVLFVIYCTLSLIGALLASVFATDY